MSLMVDSSTALKQIDDYCKKINNIMSKYGKFEFEIEEIEVLTNTITQVAERGIFGQKSAIDTKQNRRRKLYDKG